MNHSRHLLSVFRVSLPVLTIVGANLAMAPADVQAQGNSQQNLDHQLRALLGEHLVGPIDDPEQHEAVAILGQALFFDRLLSGNMDIACTTCHHPLLATGDGLSLPVGTGTPTVGAIGVMREKGRGREFIPRNAPEIFNRGSVHWLSQFWDSRVEEVPGGFVTPADPDLPEGLTSVLAAQAMFPVTSRNEMRGSLADAANGNELAAIDDSDLQRIWDTLMVRLLSIDGYRILFAIAYPDVEENELGFQDVANAIAAFESAAFGYDDSPFDDYLRGDDTALSQVEKRGAILFYDKAGCANCHSGTLLTDQDHYNLAVPQLGTGKDPATGLDFGRFGVTGNVNDVYRFRTPPLRNVAATGPWMHNGAYGNLEVAVRHHPNAARTLRKYRPKKQLFQEELRETIVDDDAVLDELAVQLDIAPLKLNSREMKNLLSFLESLTVPDLENRLLSTIPEDVPSGLVEDGIPVMLQP